MTAGFLAFVAAVVLGLILYSLWDRRRARKDTPQRAAPEQMAELALGAVQVAREVYDTALDYSPGSVEQVEAILAQLHEEHRSQSFFRERLIAEANRWGAYVGEVARRVRGGEWQRDSAHAGPNSFPVVFRQNEIYPCAWCFRRITNGAEDNVWVKFRLSVTERPSEGLHERQPGDV